MLTTTHTLTEPNEQPLALAQCSCQRCKNIFWVKAAPEHQPSFCPYCGIKFMHYEDPNGDAFSIAGLPRTPV